MVIFSVHKGILTRAMVAPEEGVPANYLGNADALISGPSILDGDTYAQLTTYNEDNDLGRAFTMAVQQSQTDMLKAVPTQNVTQDTRSTKWTLTQATDALSDSGSSVANLASAAPVKLFTTRIRGSVQVTIPATAAVGDNTYLLAPIFPLQGMSFGLEIGANASVVQDRGTSSDQPTLLSMMMARKTFRNQEIISIVSDANFYPATDAATVLSSQTTESIFTVQFECRPTAGIFQCEKVWPPSIPLKLYIDWSPNSLKDLVNPAAGNTGTGAVIKMQITDIISDEVILNPLILDHMQMSFMAAPATNMDIMLRNMRKGQAGQELYDHTFGGQVDQSQMAAIFQYRVQRLSRFTVSGGSFDVFPVTNGSARPTEVVVIVPKHVSYPTNAQKFGSNLYATNILTSLQLIYDGKNYWHQPQNNFQMYSSSLKSVGANYILDKNWFPYDTKSFDFIVFKTGPSHNSEDVQPARSTQMELRGTWDASIPQYTQFTLFVGLFFDQTAIALKNNTIIQSLPIF